MFLCPPAESLQACAKTCVYFACSTNLQIPAYSRIQVSDHDFQIRFEFYNHACIAMQSYALKYRRQRHPASESFRPLADRKMTECMFLFL